MKLCPRPRHKKKSPLIIHLGIKACLSLCHFKMSLLALATSRRSLSSRAVCLFLRPALLQWPLQSRLARLPGDNWAFAFSDLCSCSFCLHDHRTECCVEPFTGLSGSHLWSAGPTPPDQKKSEGKCMCVEVKTRGVEVLVSEDPRGSCASEYSSAPLLEQIPAKRLSWLYTPLSCGVVVQVVQKNDRASLCTLLNSTLYVILSLVKAFENFHLSVPQTSVLFLFNMVSTNDLFSCGEWM